MTRPTVRDSTSGLYTLGSGATVVVPGPTSAVGDIAVFAAAYRGTGAVSFADTAGGHTAWTRVDVGPTAGDERLSVFYKVLEGDLSARWTLTSSATGTTGGYTMVTINPQGTVGGVYRVKSSSAAALPIAMPGVPVSADSLQVINAAAWDYGAPGTVITPADGALNVQQFGNSVDVLTATIPGNTSHTFDNSPGGGVFPKSVILAVGALTTEDSLGILIG